MYFICYIAFVTFKVHNTLSTPIRFFPQYKILTVILFFLALKIFLVSFACFRQHYEIINCYLGKKSFCLVIMVSYSYLVCCLFVISSFSHSRVSGFLIFSLVCLFFLITNRSCFIF